MEDGGSAFDFEALDEDAEQISLISTAPASSADGGEEYQSDGGGLHETKYELEEEFDIAVEGQGFSALRPHYLDVLSDWGETEKFIIDGDSLLLHAMREQQVDWTRGGQFLHLAYAVEQFLSELVSRGALFCIAFFESHTSVWKKNSSIFARALLIKHFKRTLPSTASLAFFDSPYSKEWVTFLTSFQPSLVAVADAPLLCDSAEEERFPLLRFAQVCRRSGVNVLLLRDVEFSENILRGFYVQSQKSGSTRSLWMALAGSTESAGAGVLNGKADVDPFLALPRVKSENFRILASAWACTLWMEGPGASGGASSAMLAKTFMLQAALIQMGCVTLEQRACCVSQNSGERTTEFLEFVFGALSKSAWPLCEKPEARPEDLCDFADGRLFHSVLGFVALKGSADASAFGLDSTSSDAAATAWACVEGSPLFPLNMVEADRSLLVLGTCAAVPKDAADFALVAVSGCTLIDDAMKGGVHREVGARESAVQGSMLPEAVQGKGWRLEASLDETFLWTHCRDQSASAAPSSRNMSEWERRRQLRWKARQSQMYFRHLHEYATSLAGTTVLGASSQSAGASVSASADEPQQGDAEGEGNAKGGKKGAGGKKGGKEDKKKPEKKLSKKEQMLADIEAKKQKGVASKLEGDWKELKSALSSSASNVAKIKDLDDFIARCLSAGQMPLALEVTLRKLSECKEGWAEDRQGRGENMKFAIMTFECVRTVLTTHAELIQDPALPAAERARLDVVQTMIQFGFVDAALSIADGLLDKKHQEARKEYDEEVKDMARQFRNKLSVHSKSSAHFQLEHMGHLLPRPPPKVKDPRITSFTPDDWQRSLLDAVDARDCALVCAPTSSGKTFISHYCMDKVMHDTTHKDGVVVFVAPTKALINQIAAQVYGSFHSHFGIYTDAYRHRALTCRILITVPECLESLLMSPSSAVWAQKIRYVILDEIHCISTSEEGKVWEHILLMLHAPFLALSATVGEPEKFVRWLQRIKDLQKQVDGSSRDESYIVKLVQHTERFVDLRRHLYIGQEDWDSKAAASSVRYAKLHNRARVDHTSTTVEGAEFLETLHPLVSFTRAQLDLCEIPQNLKFEPKDSLSLVDAMQTVVRRCEAIPLAARVEALETLDPVNYFKGDQTFITKPQAARFEDAVKEELTLWMKEGWKEEVVKVLLLLGNKIVSDQGAQDEDEPGKQTRWMDRLFHLMCVLHRQDRLPAVVFNFDRSACERIAFHFSGILQSAEDSARQEHAKTLSKSKKTLEQKEKVQKRMRDKIISEKKEIERLDELAEMEETSAFDTSVMDDTTFRAQFSFVQEGKGSMQDFERITESARKTMGEAHPLIQILRHGIGVHHNGLANKYKMAVEMLFRCGYLRIVVSTETLAYGINMPCRTVVFAQDSISLNSIQYQQMSGRAGRRGLDVLGHIVFFEVPRYKLHRLIVAPVPRLRGHKPTLCGLVSRLLTLHHQVPNTRGASSEITKRVRNSVLRALAMPLYNSEREELTEVSKHQLRHSFDFLVKIGLIKPEGGVPGGLCALAEHLHFAEPSNFALVALLQSGALHEISVLSDERPWDTVAKELLTVLAFLFCRQRLHPSIAADKKLIDGSQSMIVLPALPHSCSVALTAYNKTALDSLIATARASASCLPKELPTLPLSGAEFDAQRIAADYDFDTDMCIKAGGAFEGHAFSAFALLSGCAHAHVTLEGVVARARACTSLHRGTVPVVPGADGDGEGGEMMLNAYVLDFFSHAHFATIVRDNGVPSGTAWQGLRAFQLILVSLSKSIAAVAPPEDTLGIAIIRLEQEFSAKFFSKLYK